MVVYADDFCRWDIVDLERLNHFASKDVECPQLSVLSHSIEEVSLWR